MSLVSRIHNKTRITDEVYHHDCVEMHFETNARLGLYLYNLLKKNNFVNILNEEELEKQAKKGEVEPKEDGITIIKTEDGEEIFILDLVEEPKSKKQTEDSPEKLGTLTSLEKND